MTTAKSQATDADDKDQSELAAVQTIPDYIGEDEIDNNLIGTFPASDPPSWTLGVERDKNRPRDRQK
jgi:hypothetical protein